jgi:hypothetical protein
MDGAADAAATGGTGTDAAADSGGSGGSAGVTHDASADGSAEAGEVDGTSPDASGGATGTAGGGGADGSGGSSGGEGSGGVTGGAGTNGASGTGEPPDASVDGSDGGPACPPERIDCAGVCDGPGVSSDGGCCASGRIDCNGQCDGPAVPATNGCCLSGRLDCSGVCDGPGTIIGDACCPTGSVDCAGVCDGPGITRGAECCPTGVCPPASCDDPYVNGDESDLGCGGGTCPGCDAGARCRLTSDCTFRTECVAGRCVVRALDATQQLVANVLGIARNPVDGTVYASIASSAPSNGGRVVAFSPYSIQPSWSVATGVETVPLAVSDDGSTLYAGVQSAQASVVRVDLATRQVVASFRTGIHETYGSVQPFELDVRPGNPNTVAVAGFFFGHSGSPGIHVFTNGVDHNSAPDVMDWHNSPAAGINDVTSMVFARPDTLYANDGANRHLSTVHVGTTGLEIAREDRNLFHELDAELAYGGGRLFATTGEIVDPAGPSLLGMIAGSRNAKTALSPSGARAYQVLRNDEVLGRRWEVHCFDVATFRWTGGFVIDTALASTQRYLSLGEVEVWGTRGLAVRFVNVIDGHALWMSPNALEVPGCSPEADAPRQPPRIDSGDGALGSAVVLDVAANAIAADRATGGVYLAVASSDPRLPNHVAYVPSDSVRIAWSAYAGSEPAALGPTVDGAALWVGLAGAPVVQSIDTTSRRASQSFTLHRDVLDGFEFARLLEPLPGEPRSVAVTPYSRGPGAWPILRIYDGGIDREAWKQRTRVEERFSGLEMFGVKFRGNTMFGVNGPILSTFDVTPQGLEERTRNLSLSGAALLNLIGDRLIASSGDVVDIPSLYPLGTVRFGVDAVSDDGARGYAVTDSHILYCYDLRTFTETGSVDLGVPASYGYPAGVVRWNASGLAVNTTLGPVLFYPDLLERTPGCTPRSTGVLPPGPTVSPNKVAADGSVLEYDIDVRGLATSASDGTLYVTVTQIDPRFANQLVAFAPNGNTSSWALRVGSRPGPLTVSDDGTTVYVGLEGAGRIVKVDTTARAVGTPFPIGLIDGELPLALDIDVSPASNDLIVATVQPNENAYANGTTSPVLFESGRRVFPDPLLPDSFGEWTGTTKAEFTDANTVFTHGMELRKLSVSGSTLTEVWSSPDMVTPINLVSSDRMSFGGGRLFYSGFVIDPAGPTLIGRVPNSGGTTGQSGIPIMTEDGQRIIGITNQGDAPNTQFSIRCFDAGTMAQIGQTYSFTPPTYNQIHFAGTIHPWGPNGVAVLTSGKRLLLMPRVLRDIGCR